MSQSKHVYKCEARVDNLYLAKLNCCMHFYSA